MSKITKKAAGVILWRRQGNDRVYLLLANALHHTWGFPKGHQEPGEGILACAERELQEETGIADIVLDDSFREVLTYEVQYPGGEKFEKMVTYFLGQTDTEDVALSEEHSSGDWYDFDQAINLLQHEDLRKLLTAAETVLKLDESL